MYKKYSIIHKIFLWYIILLIIFYGTIILFFLNIQKIMLVSNDIVNKKYVVSSSSKKMIDSLLSMEENQKKYGLLKKEEYWNFFVTAKREFEENFTEVRELVSGTNNASLWEELYQSYNTPEYDMQPPGGGMAEKVWIPEDSINEWIQLISMAQAENGREVELAMRALHHRGQTTTRWGLVGLGVSVLLGLLGVIFLTYSIRRPIRELRGGIGSISKEGSSKPIRVFSKDEFGELSVAFNEMIYRLGEEERMRSDFVAMLSHEIRTPLTSILESVNLILEELLGPINERQERFLQIASREIERINELLHVQLQVSRMETGLLEIHPRPFDPAILVANSLQRLTPAAEAKGIETKVEAPARLSPVKGDPDYLQQVLLNLVGNAIKFSCSGGEVVVRVEPDKDEKSLRFSVSDNGRGIPEEEQPLVFSKYYRVSGVGDQADGFGLGLSVSKQIVEVHGGDIWLESRLGQGSTFGFTIPLAPEE